MIYQTPLLNPGGHYNSNTGEYTCPKTGVYMFFYSVYSVFVKRGDSYSVLSASLYVNSARVSRVFSRNDNSGWIYITLSHTDIVACQAGQRVWVQSDESGNFIYDYTDTNVFGGVLLYTT